MDEIWKGLAWVCSTIIIATLTICISVASTVQARENNSRQLHVIQSCLSTGKQWIDNNCIATP